MGTYSYCAHAWWLGSVRGKDPDDWRSLKAGAVAHERHGRKVLASTTLTRLAYLLLLLAGIVGVGWLFGLLIR